MEDYQRRIVDEKSELDKKLEKLVAFMRTGFYAGLPADEQARMHKQMKAMTDYSDVIGERIDKFA